MLSITWACELHRMIVLLVFILKLDTLAIASFKLSPPFQISPRISLVIHVKSFLNCIDGPASFNSLHVSPHLQRMLLFSPLYSISGYFLRKQSNIEFFLKQTIYKQNYASIRWNYSQTSTFDDRISEKLHLYHTKIGIGVCSLSRYKLDKLSYSYITLGETCHEATWMIYGEFSFVSLFNEGTLCRIYV